jgi:hypothetical protein
MEEQAAAGRPMEEVFEEALRGNDCVGALGACVAVAMGAPATGLRAAIPLSPAPPFGAGTSTALPGRWVSL